MNKFLIFLIIISVYILSKKKKKKLYEGISNNIEENVEETKEEIKEETKEEKVEENYSKDDCPYRLKKNLGKMCNEKWGQPDCKIWEKNRQC